MAIRIQCSACNKTLQVAETAAGKKARCPSCQTINDVPAAAGSPPATASSPSSIPTPKPIAHPTAATPSAAAKPAAPASSAPETMLVACSNCGKASKVMRSSAGKTVQCPHCQGKIVVPGGKPAPKPTPAPKPSAPASVDIFGSVPTSNPSRSSGSTDIFGSVPSSPSYDPYGGSAYGNDSYGDSGSNNNSLWNEIGDSQSGGGNAGWQPMMSAPANPYATPYGGGGGYGGGYSAPVRRDRSPALYIIPGVFIALWGLLIVIGACLRIGLITIAVTNLPPNVEANWPYVIGLIIGALIGLTLGALQLFGGIAMILRNNLAMARTGAVICAIPCFGILAWPFGVWGAVLLFTGTCNRDFGE